MSLPWRLAASFGILLNIFPTTLYKMQLLRLSFKSSSGDDDCPWFDAWCLLPTFLLQVTKFKKYKYWHLKPGNCFELPSDWLSSYWESQSEGSSKQLQIKSLSLGVSGFVLIIFSPILVSRSQLLIWFLITFLKTWY